MGYSEEHVADTRRRILESAGKLFRARGFQGVGIDEIMAGAGLTRGGFYAHFRSKEDLLRRVLEQEFEFTMRLRDALEQDAVSDARACSDALAAIDYYLAPGNRRRIARGCTLVSNTPDVARASTQTRDAYTASFRDLADQFEALLAASTDGDRDRALAAIATCVGGVSLARCLRDEALATRMLGACRAAVHRELGYGDAPPRS